MQKGFDVLFTKLGIEPVPEELLRLAFTHSSAQNESKLPSFMNNERIEFLGDSVVNFCMSDLLYRMFPQADEGWLTRRRAALVCEKSLAAVAIKLNLGALIKLSKAEQAMGGASKTAILADVFEALCGAIFIAHGYQTINKIVGNLLLDPKHMEQYVDEATHIWKSRLQEYVQGNGSSSIHYSTSQSGLVHSPTFEASVEVDGVEMGRGHGGTKKEAEQMAAKQALENLENHKA